MSRPHNPRRRGACEPLTIRHLEVTDILTLADEVTVTVILTSTPSLAYRIAVHEPDPEFQG